MTRSRLERILEALDGQTLPPRQSTPPPGEDEPQTSSSRSQHRPLRMQQDEIAANELRLARLAISRVPSETREPEILYDDLPQAKQPVVFSYAAPAVFGIGELADEIFDHLPMKDLVNARLVCRTAWSSINKSPKLRRRLFLDPGSIEDIHRDDRVPLASLVESPELWTQKLLNDLEAYIPEQLTDGFDMWQIMANPLLVRHCENKNSPVKFRQLPRIGTEFLRTDDDFWERGMYLTQPPLLLKNSIIGVDSRACEIHSKVQRLEENSDYRNQPVREALGTGKKLGELIKGLDEGMQSFCPHSKPDTWFYGWTFELADVDGDGNPVIKQGQEYGRGACISKEQAEAEWEKNHTWINDVD